jgi:hypothetical protein
MRLTAAAPADAFGTTPEGLEIEVVTLLVAAVMLAVICAMLFPVLMRQSSVVREKEAFDAGYLYGRYGKPIDYASPAWSTAELESWGRGQAAGSADAVSAAAPAARGALSTKA